MISTKQSEQGQVQVDKHRYRKYQFNEICDPVIHVDQITYCIPGSPHIYNRSTNIVIQILVILHRAMPITKEIKMINHSYYSLP